MDICVNSTAARRIKSAMRVRAVGNRAVPQAVQTNLAQILEPTTIVMSGFSIREPEPYAGIFGPLSLLMDAWMLAMSHGSNDSFRGSRNVWFWHFPDAYLDIF